MNILCERFLLGVAHGGNPGAAATSIFQEFDFADLDIVDFDGAESTHSPGCLSASAKIRFYVAAEDAGKDSVAMTFHVDFTPEGAQVSVYSD